MQPKPPHASRGVLLGKHARLSVFEARLGYCVGACAPSCARVEPYGCCVSAESRERRDGRFGGSAG